MQRSRLELEPGLVLDARRAVWLPESGTLAVADLHLGYAWSHRASGNLLPVTAREDTVERLLALVDDYAPRELVVLGDIVHRAVRVESLRDELRRLVHEIGARTQFRLIAGNHDAQLGVLLAECGLAVALPRAHRAGPHLLLHGDCTDDAEAAGRLSTVAGRLIIGHEHPAIALSDGVATSARCPCFLAGERLLVLPAFSRWAAGANVRAGGFLSAFTRHAALGRVVAIVAGKLLPLPL